MAYSFSKKFNKSRLFNVDTSNFEYYNLEDLFNEELEVCSGDVEAASEFVYVIRGVYINTKSLYDPAPVIALDDRYVNLPSHMTEACMAMLADPVCIKAINDGKCGFKIYTYEQKRYNKTCYSVEWVDV